MLLTNIIKYFINIILIIIYLAFMTMISDKNNMKNGSACIKYRSHIVQTAGNEQTPANSVFIHTFVY